MMKMNNKRFTLIELMAAMFVIGIAFGGIAALMVQGLNTHKDSFNRDELVMVRSQVVGMLGHMTGQKLFDGSGAFLASSLSSGGGTITVDDGSLYPPDASANPKWVFLDGELIRYNSLSGNSFNITSGTSSRCFEEQRAYLKDIGEDTSEYDEQVTTKTPSVATPYRVQVVRQVPGFSKYYYSYDMRPMGDPSDVYRVAVTIIWKDKFSRHETFEATVHEPKA